MADHPSLPTKLESPKTATEIAESPTTVRPFEMDDDDMPDSGIPVVEPLDSCKSLKIDDEPPNNPPLQSLKSPKPEVKAEDILKEAFPSIDLPIITAVLRASSGQIEPAFNALLGMSDPEAAKEMSQPPPMFNSNPFTNVGSTLMSQLEADERYARQLSNQYKNSKMTVTGEPIKSNARITRPHNSHDERSFLEDDLPIIKDNLKKGFMETQNKFNNWITNLKKKIDGEDELDSIPPTYGSTSCSSRFNIDGRRKSDDFSPYDADPQVLGDDFAGIQINSDGTFASQSSKVDGSQIKSTLVPPSTSQSHQKPQITSLPREIEIHKTSKPVVKNSSNQGKWQPLSTIEPKSVSDTDNDPFSLGDTDDEETKDRTVGREGKTGIAETQKISTKSISDNIVKREIECIETATVKKFGKQIQKLQLELPDYSASFVNYKALKKLINRPPTTSLPSIQNEIQIQSGTVTFQTALEANKAFFFFQLERELEKVNAVYLLKEAELQIRLKTLLEKKKILKSKNHTTSRRFAKFTTLEEGFQQFVNDLNKLQQLVETNRTAFSKILKKWDKASKSKTKELYLSRAVEVQPFFNPVILSELSDQAITSLQELGAWSEGDHFYYESNFDHVVSSQHLLGTDEGDADTLLLDTVNSGNVESLRDLLSRLRTATQQNNSGNHILQERITRTFLTATNGAPQNKLQLLIDTGLVDLHSEDDINERNCLHQATIYDNIFVLKQGLKANVAVSRADVYGQIPLHYACMHGRLDEVELLLDSDPSTIDFIDHDHFTPLIHAIRRGHFDCIKQLILRSARINPISDGDHIPLNLACEYGSTDIVELLLKHGANILPNIEGQYPQHLVARSGKTPQLLLLLKEYGADLNQTDKLYSWTPLFYAASEGKISCIRILLDVGVHIDILDEKGLSAIYYAAWKGHLGCMRLISSAPINTRIQNTSKPIPNFDLAESNRSRIPSVDIDTIPELELPPPIIPLRRYGHSFLDTKTLIQISFDREGHQPLTFFHDCKYPAARLTISSKIPDFIPKNILLPFQKDTKLVSFQIDNLDTFAIDFDVFPTYGAKIIAKTVALPHTFRPLMNNSGHCCLPLFDPRLRVIGQIAFSFQVIKPFQGEPLEIKEFETYWKATSHLNFKKNSLVTDSSLSGDHVQLFVQQTCDRIPILWPKWKMNYFEIEIPISRLTYKEFISIGSMQAKIAGELKELRSKPLGMAAEIHCILSNSAISLKDALNLLPRGMHINLQILYPSFTEEEAFNLGPINSIDIFCDAILSTVFDHARNIRECFPNAMRSIVFSSYNQTICTALNWKQPNYPIFLDNDLGCESVFYDSRKTEISGRQSISIKEAVKIAKDNNFMGLCCSSALLEIVPSLADTIKHQGLILVIDKYSIANERNKTSYSSYKLPESSDGALRANGILRFDDNFSLLTR